MDEDYQEADLIGMQIEKIYPITESLQFELPEGFEKLWGDSILYQDDRIKILKPSYLPYAFMEDNYGRNILTLKVPDSKSGVSEIISFQNLNTISSFIATITNENLKLNIRRALGIEAFQISESEVNVIGLGKLEQRVVAKTVGQQQAALGGLGENYRYISAFGLGTCFF